MFLDTNIFLSYATDFEPSHFKSVRLFHGNHNRYTGIRVKAELGKIRKRRNKLYEDLYLFLTGEGKIQTFTPQIDLLSNDKTHLDQLISQLSKNDKDEVLRMVRKLTRLIEQSVEYALSLVIKPYVPISSDLSCQAQIGQLIRNTSDAEILVDAFCWAETHHASTIIFCTTDYTDFLRNRHKIYRIFCKNRGCTLTELPLEISGINEVVPK